MPAGEHLLVPRPPDVKELALYVQDTITKGNWNLNLGIRGDLYNGLTNARRRSLGWVLPTTSSRPTPYCAFPMRGRWKPHSTKISCYRASGVTTRSCSAACTLEAHALSPGFRNEFHAGLQQAFGKHIVFDGEYIWKYTHNAYDFSVLGNTPITFPIEWHNRRFPDSRCVRNVTNSTALRRTW